MAQQGENQAAPVITGDDVLDVRLLGGLLVATPGANKAEDLRVSFQWAWRFVSRKERLPHAPGDGVSPTLPAVALAGTSLIYVPSPAPRRPASTQRDTRRAVGQMRPLAATQAGLFGPGAATLLVRRDPPPHWTGEDAERRRTAVHRFAF